MLNYRRLPASLRNPLLRKMPTETLYAHIMGETPVKGVFNAMGYGLTNEDEKVWKPLLKMIMGELREEFMSRRGEDALRIQHQALGVWLRDISRSDKLAFLNTEEEKKAFLVHLDAALKDPKSSYSHKIRCSLLINKIYPNKTHDNTHLVAAKILSEFPSNPRKENIYTALQPIFSDDHFKYVTTYILDKMTAQETEKNAHSFPPSRWGEKLEEVVSHASQAQCGTLITPMLEKFKDADNNRECLESYFIKTFQKMLERVSVDSFGSIWSPLHDKSVFIDYHMGSSLAVAASRLPQAKVDAMIDSLCLKPDNEKSHKKMRNLVEIGVFASQPKYDALMDKFLSNLKKPDSSKDNKCYLSLGTFITFHYEIECISRAERVYFDRPYSDGDVSDGLKKLSKRAGETHDKKLIPALLTLLSDSSSNSNITNSASNVLIEVAHDASKTQCDQIIDIFMQNNRNAHDFTIYNLAHVLGKIAPRASDSQREQIIDIALSALQGNKRNVMICMTYVLKATLPCVSPEKRAATIATLQQMFENQDKGISLFGAIALGQLFEYLAPAQRNAVIPVVLNAITDLDEYIAWAATSNLDALISALNAIQVCSMILSLSLKFDIKTSVELFNSHELVRRFVPHMSKETFDSLIEPILEGLNEHTRDISDETRWALKEIIPRASTEQRDRIIIALLNKKESDGTLRGKNSVWVLFFMAPYASPETAKTMIPPLMNSLFKANAVVGQYCARALSQLVPTHLDLIMTQLSEHSATNPANLESLTLQLIAQTRVHLNAIQQPVHGNGNEDKKRTHDDAGDNNNNAGGKRLKQ